MESIDFQKGMNHRVKAALLTHKTCSFFLQNLSFYIVKGTFGYAGDKRS